jgi:XTP/dITP diphosphohydrolase
MQLVIASQNVHKIREFRAIFKELPKVDVLSLIDFPHYISPPETGSTFEENAVHKAMSAASALNQWVLADDSGLIVPALHDRPGVYSSRYAGDDATDAENRKKLLREMEHIQEAQRQAYFECCLALASPQGLKKCAKGICEGTILNEERGNRGFGYDPIFVKYEYGKTFAELEEDIKNRISHRRKALDKILLTLETLVGS